MNKLQADPLIDSDYISRSEQRVTGRAARPRDSATLILVRTDGKIPRVLMGKRSQNHVFMPNKFVFPGGKVEIADGRLRVPNQLHPAVLRRLMKGCSETKARALALAAIRETFEETGIILGKSGSTVIKSRSDSWAKFLRHGMTPHLEKLYYVARAITPPYRNRRFDARFFMAYVDQKSLYDVSTEASGELLEIHWVTLGRARKLELPHITRVMLDEIERRVAHDDSYHQEGPFVYAKHGRFVNGKQ